MTGRARTAILAASLALLTWTATAWCADPAGSVTAVDGTAEVQRAGSGAWTALADGDAVFAGDQVRTGAESKLKLTFRDQSIFTLAPASTLVVTEQVAGTVAPVSRFGLLLGTVRAVVNERYGTPGAKFEMNTPTAVAAVHGTGFIATYDPKLDESVFVGLFDTTLVCAVTDPDCRHQVRLGPGDTTRVGRGSLPLAPSRAPEGVLRGLNAATTIVPDVAGGGRRGAAVGPGKGGGNVHNDAASAPQSPIDAPVEILKRSNGKPAPPPPPVPRGGNGHPPPPPH